MFLKMSVLIYFSLMGSLGLAQVQKYELRGEATSLDQKTKLYTEVHQIETDEQGLNLKIQTQYLNPDGTLRATKLSDFSKNRFVPETQFKDQKHQIEEQLTFKEDGQNFHFRAKKENSSDWKEKSFKVQSDQVVGQGFDNFVKANFEILQKQKQPMKFGVISQLDFFQFQAQGRESTTDGLKRFGLQIKNVFLRVFLDELQVEYDPKSKELKTYKGLSNLLDDKKKQQQVLIRYQSKR